MASTQIVEYTYTDPRTGHLIQEREVREFPDAKAVSFRNPERGDFIEFKNDGYDYRRRRRSFEDDRRLAVLSPRSRRRERQDDDNDDRRKPRDYNRDKRMIRRRAASTSSSGSDQDARGEKDRDTRIRRHRSLIPSRRERREEDPNDDDGNISDGGYLWYSMKKRKDANFFERNFDSSYDGLISAAAGAALGVITAQRFANEENRTYKTAGAALAGAVTFNAAENWYRVFTEEREEEKREEKEEREERRKR